MDWQLVPTIVAAIGTFLTALFSAWHYVLSPYLVRRKQETLEKQQELRVKIQNRISIRNSIEFNINNAVKKNTPERPDIGIGFLGDTDQESSAKIREYYNNHNVYSDWLRACKELLDYKIEDTMRQHLPETLQKHRIDGAIRASDTISCKFMDGQNVTATWLKENLSDMYKQLLVNLQEPELELDKVFFDLNKYVTENNSFRRYRDEKNRLIELGTKIMEKLNEEIKNLETELKPILL